MTYTIVNLPWVSSASLKIEVLLSLNIMTYQRYYDKMNNII